MWSLQPTGAIQSWESPVMVGAAGPWDPLSCWACVEADDIQVARVLCSCPFFIYFFDFFGISKNRVFSLTLSTN